MKQRTKLMIELTLVLVGALLIVPVISGMVLTLLYEPNMLEGRAAASSSSVVIEGNPWSYPVLAVVVLLVYGLVRTGILMIARAGAGRK
ncbi:hypothetical protein M3231_07215 [Neobacillus mesonae]|nr:hypothetical protein [Neobacillus mesonae]